MNPEFQLLLITLRRAYLFGMIGQMDLATADLRQAREMLDQLIAFMADPGAPPRMVGEPSKLVFSTGADSDG